MTNITQYRCPVCSMIKTAKNFVNQDIMEPADMGYLIIRECKGKKGFPIISEEALVLSKNPTSAEILKTLKHHTLALFHSLYQHQLIQEKDLRTYEDFEKLFYNLDNARHEIRRLKTKVNSVLKHQKQRKQGTFQRTAADYPSLDLSPRLIAEIEEYKKLLEEANYTIENLQNENGTLKVTIDNTNYSEQSFGVDDDEIYAGGY